MNILIGLLDGMLLLGWLFDPPVEPKARSVLLSIVMQAVAVPVIWGIFKISPEMLKLNPMGFGILAFMTALVFLSPLGLFVVFPELYAFAGKADLAMRTRYMFLPCIVLLILVIAALGPAFSVPWGSALLSWWAVNAILAAFVSLAWMFYVAVMDRPLRPEDLPAADDP